MGVRAAGMRRRAGGLPGRMFVFFRLRRGGRLPLMPGRKLRQTDTGRYDTVFWAGNPLRPVDPRIARDQVGHHAGQRGIHADLCAKQFNGHQRRSDGRIGRAGKQGHEAETREEPDRQVHQRC